MLKQTQKTASPPNVPFPKDLKDLINNKKSGKKTLPSDNNIDTTSEDQNQNSTDLKTKGEKIDQKKTTP